jgi:hypothetical protein
MFSFGLWVDALTKAVGHKYIKRIPYQSKGKRRYRYIYKVTHSHQGRHAFDEAHLQEGTAFSLSTKAGSEYHGHVVKVEGDQVSYRIDDGPEKGTIKTESKRELLAKLNDVHGIESKLSSERDKLRNQIKEAKKNRASDKQIARLEARLSRLGGEQEGEKQGGTDTTKRQASKKATELLIELERIKDIAKQGPRGKYRRLSASRGDYGSRNFPDLDSPAKLYQALRDNIANVGTEGDYTHATDQISAFLASGALQSEQGYMLRRLLREINPLNQSSEELRREEAEDERSNRFWSDTLAEFHDLEAQNTKPSQEAQQKQSAPVTTEGRLDLKQLKPAQIAKYIERQRHTELALASQNPEYLSSLSLTTGKLKETRESAEFVSDDQLEERQGFKRVDLGDLASKEVSEALGREGMNTVAGAFSGDEPFKAWSEQIKQRIKKTRAKEDRQALKQLTTAKKGSKLVYQGVPYEVTATKKLANGRRVYHVRLADSDEAFVPPDAPASASLSVQGDQLSYDETPPTQRGIVYYGQADDDEDGSIEADNIYSTIEDHVRKWREGISRGAIKPYKVPEQFN